MHARLLDVLHNSAYQTSVPSARVDVDLDRIAQELVDQHGGSLRYLGCFS